MKGIHHVSTKKFTGAGLTIGAAVTALLLGTTAASASEAHYSSAFGVSASGLLDIDPTPFVESEDGDLVEDELAGIDEGILRAGLLTVAAQDGEARSAVLDVEIEDILKAEVIETSCVDGDGGLKILGLDLGDGAFELDIPEGELIKNEKIDLTPLVKLSLGEQTRNSDDTITVTGIKVEVLPVTESRLGEPVDREEADLLGGLLGTDLSDALVLGDVLEDLNLGTDEALQTVTIGSATCGDYRDDDGGNGDDKGDDDKGDDGKGDDGKGDDDKDDIDAGDDDEVESDDDTGAAPAPTVVQASLPVTG